jgi:hypothetical protein
MKIIKKISFVIIIIAILSVICTVECHASYKNFNPSSTLNSTLDSIAETPVMGVLQAIFAVVQVGITGVLLIKLTLVGIRYFFGAATAVQKAEDKNKLMWSVLQILAWFTIMALIIGLFNSLAG